MIRQLAAWWAWLGQVQIIIRWPVQPPDPDWTRESIGPVR